MTRLNLGQSAKAITTACQSHLTHNEKNPLGEAMTTVRPQFIQVTPALAAEWLANNPSNRLLNRSRVERLKQQLAAGQWKLNGDTIKIARDGRLLDGQHRLTALVELGMTVEMLVVFGLDMEAFDTIDTGKSRTPGDVLHAAGIPNANVMAAAAAFVMAIDSANFAAFEGRDRASPGARLQFVRANPTLEASVHVGRSVGVVLNCSAAAALHFVFARKDREAADLFMADLATGAALKPGDPLLVLRERLIERRGRGLYMRTSIICAFAIKAWNERRAGKTIKLLKVLDSEPFPRVR